MRDSVVSDYGLAAVVVRIAPDKIPQIFLRLMVYSAVIFGIQCTELRPRGLPLADKVVRV